jgi:hypothetical protein
MAQKSKTLAQKKHLKNYKTMKTAIYLFCLARADRQLDHVIQESQIFLHKYADIVAVLKYVPLEEFCGAEAESRLQELAWVAPRASQHEKVIEQIMRQSPVLPVSFATLFSSLENLEQHLERHYAVIFQFIMQMTDKEEWSVKGFLDRASAQAKLYNKQLAEQTLPESPGLRYFQERRLQIAVEKQLNHWLKSICQDVANDLEPYIVDFAKRKVLSTSENKEMVVNWAFLLSRDTVKDFTARLEQINVDYAASGLVFESSGPWPPYSFISQSLEFKT